MIKHNDVKQSSLSEFSGLKGKGGYNYTSDPPSILTVRGIGLKNSECAQLKEVDPFNPDIPIRKPIPEEIEDDRDPTDEPILPDDPGDEPDVAPFRLARSHIGEEVKVTYRYRDFIAHTQGRIAWGGIMLRINLNSRQIKIRWQNLISFESVDKAWMWPHSRKTGKSIRGRG